VVERVALITALILDRPVCLKCLTTRTEMSMEETVAVLELIESALTVHRELRRCLACDADPVPTVFVDQPAL
jgi:hypothetical protein